MMGIFISDERIKKLSKFGQILIGLLSFAVLGLVLLAIYFYPGQYNFFTNYISDLGRTVTPEGFDNSTSSSIYLLAMLMMGLVSLGFWFFTQNVIYHAFTTKWKYLVILGSFLGMLSSVAIGITGFFPLDTQQSTHNLLGVIFFVLGGIAMGLYAVFFIILFFIDKDIEKLIIYSIISVFVPLIFAFIVIGILDQISSVYIIILVGVLLITNLIFQLAFKSFINYLSYIISFSILVLEFALVLLITSLLTVSAVMEVTFVLGMVAFMVINNVRIFEIDF
jgi:hypothetical protein